MTKIIDLYTLTDEEIISSYQAGNADTTELYNRYNNLVYGCCLKYFKNKQDAQDARSEIFLMIREKLKTHEVSNFKSWLYTVSRNYCIEILRKNNTARTKVKEAERMYSDLVFHPDNVVDENLLLKLRTCIEQLPDKQRMIIDLFYYQKVSYKDIAEKTGMEWNKVRSYIQNGRRNLEKCLTNK